MSFVDSLAEQTVSILTEIKDFIIERSDILKMSFIGRNKRMICPFCFNEIALQEIWLRCTYSACPGRELDTTYAIERNIPPVMDGHTWSLPSFGTKLPRDTDCTACGRKSSTRICPKCHYKLPPDIGKIDQRIIAIIGGSNTGKSHYIPVLIERLKNEVGSEFGFTVHTYLDETRIRYEQEFYNPLFINNSVIQATRPAAIDSRVMAPLIFRLTFGSRGRSKHIMSLYFFDTAGEDMRSVETLTHQNRYIVNANGIIFLLDPLQIQNVRQQLPFTNQLELDREAAPDYIIDRLKELFEIHHRRTNLPIAFTLSKVDTLTSIVEPGSALRRPNEHNGTLDLTDIQAMSTEIESYLNKWISPNFSGKIRYYFPNSQYFGVSSLGRQPDANNRIDGINSFRVEDPFLWILYKYGLIKCKKKRR